ncbi:MAG: hypothetical protein QMD66_03785 [Actinomycetota bacterium]|nr:hypothetical protein [Actinomycetota bacterium]MDI6821975.1 hypothetical protein [Actinomycetota bacterium]
MDRKWLGVAIGALFLLSMLFYARFEVKWLRVGGNHLEIARNYLRIGDNYIRMSRKYMHSILYPGNFLSDSEIYLERGQDYQKEVEVESRPSSDFSDNRFIGRISISLKENLERIVKGVGDE